MEKQTGRERGGRAGATDTHHYLRPSVIEFVSAPVVCFLHLIHKRDPSFLERPVEAEAAAASQEKKGKKEGRGGKALLLPRVLIFHFLFSVSKHTFICVSLPLRRGQTEI